MKKAMLTIEVLVALLILFLVIAGSTTIMKSFQIVNKQKNQYEKEYMVVLSIKDLLSSRHICVSKLSQEGNYDGFSYKAECTKIKELRNYKKPLDYGGKEGNIGSYLLKLYKVDLDIKQGKFNKNFTYYITVGDKVF